MKAALNKPVIQQASRVQEGSTQSRTHPERNHYDELIRPAALLLN